jgi:hypothetical protein
MRLRLGLGLRLRGEPKNVKCTPRGQLDGYFLSVVLEKSAKATKRTKADAAETWESEFTS